MQRKQEEEIISEINCGMIEMEHPPCLQTIVFLMIFFETVCVTTASPASLSQQTNFIQIIINIFQARMIILVFFNLAARACRGGKVTIIEENRCLQSIQYLHVLNLVSEWKKNVLRPHEVHAVRLESTQRTAAQTLNTLITQLQLTMMTDSCS